MRSTERGQSGTPRVERETRRHQVPMERPDIEVLGLRKQTEENEANARRQIILWSIRGSDDVDISKGEVEDLTGPKPTKPEEEIGKTGQGPTAPGERISS
eukprot:scaffold1033_cov65-Cyclotella_meneghiniana.AAC.6